MTEIIELRPDRRFTNPCFEKYQFSSDTVPITSEINLEKDIHRLELSPGQESWLEARLFAFHNHLYKNPYDTSCWFVDKDRTVWRLNKTGFLKQVCTLHTSHTSRPIYNVSIGFTSNRIAVISDGCTGLELIIEDLSGNINYFILEKAEPGIILNVQYIKVKSQIIVTLCSIADNEGKKYTQLTLLFYTWKHIENTQDSFQLSHRQILKVKGTVEYVYVEETGKYLHSVCQDNIIFDSQAKSIDNDKANVNTVEPIKIPKYCWSQDEDSLTVWIKIPEKRRKEVQINVTSNEINIVIDNTVLIQGQCQHKIDKTLTTWKYEKDTLQLDLFKFENGLMWNELIQNDTGGERLSNEALAAEIHSRLAHLCTDQPEAAITGQPYLGFNAEQLEECDIEGRDNVFQRIDLETQENTHLATLGTNNHVLFTYKMKNGQAICLRHDHDACVWVTNENEENMWNIKHVCTFPGFGYVEASKSNKKFCVCPPDGSYTAIVEHVRHVFVYERPNTNVQISKQWIVDMGCEMSPIMGVVATNKHLIILTKNKLYRLQIYP